MRRKKPGKGSRRKLASKKLETFHKRGTKRISIIFPSGKKTLDEIIVLLIAFDWSKIDYLRTRNKRVAKDGSKHYIPPRGFTVILKIVKGKNEFHYTKLSPVDMVVNKANIQAFTIEVIEELFERWESAKESMSVIREEEDIPVDYVEKVDARYIKEVTIHFLY